MSTVPIPDEDDGFAFLNVGGDHIIFKIDDEYGAEQRVDEDDTEAILDWIRAANIQSDWVVASLHVHGGIDGGKNDDTVPEFPNHSPTTASAGGGGRFREPRGHVFQGVEIYDGVAVFYNLGNFTTQNETVIRLPAKIYDRYDLLFTTRSRPSCSMSASSTRMASAKGSSQIGHSSRDSCSDLRVRRGRR